MKKSKERLEAFRKSFVYAGRGIWFCIRHERNFRIHLVTAAYVIGVATAFALTRLEWAVLLLAIGFVITSEALNTAVEQTINLVSPGRHVIAGTAKDVAAGGVLVSALTAAAVGIALLYRPAVLLGIWTELLAEPWKLAALALSLLISALFVFCTGAPKAVYPQEPAEKKKVEKGTQPKRKY